MTHTLTKPTAMRIGRLFVTLLLLAIPTTVDATTMICSTTTLMLIFMIDIVEAVFKPDDTGGEYGGSAFALTLLKKAIGGIDDSPRGCLDETPDGSCPIFAASDVPVFGDGNYQGDFRGNYGTGKYGLMGTWDVSVITNMENLFGQNSDNEGNQVGAFNADISNWNTERVTNMNGSTCARIDYLSSCLFSSF